MAKNSFVVEVTFNEHVHFSSYRNKKLKVKTVMSWSSQKKSGHFLYHLFSLKQIVVTFVFYLNVYIVYLIHF